MPQRKQRPGVQIALFPRLLGAGFAEQTALRRVEIKGRAVVGAAVAAVDQLRQKSALAHGTQLKYSLDDPEVGLFLAYHVKAIQEKPQFFCGFVSCGRKRRGHFRHIHGKAHPFDGGRDAVEDVFDIRLSHCIHIPSGDKHELRVTKKPAGAEQFAFQPQAALRRGRDDSQPRRQKRDDPV